MGFSSSFTTPHRHILDTSTEEETPRSDHNEDNNPECSFERRRIYSDDDFRGHVGKTRLTDLSGSKMSTKRQHTDEKPNLLLTKNHLDYFTKGSSTSGCYISSDGNNSRLFGKAMVLDCLF